MTLVCSTALVAEERPVKPNILVLLTDDLGWQDVDCYDIDEKNLYHTPHIDALAKKGILFRRAYSPAPTCAPSRCAIVSGTHPARAQKTHIKGGTPPIPYSEKTRMMSPWFSARTPIGDYTVASAMQDNGYTTGHVGKWHISYSAPKAVDLGFDISYGSRVSKALMGNRLTDFATNDEKDPYKLDANGFPYNQTTENALEFLENSKDKPFFFYYATWLVHAPIQTRSEELLNKYAKLMGVNPANKKEFSGNVEGQVNPFYGAMVEELDYNVGRVISYLENTEDPRWKGHKLIENTYIIFTSDNGGAEGKENERYTDNAPLDMGKTSVKEGGTRVPFIITGPNISAGIETNVMANGLDIYPTVLSMTGAKRPDKTLDGADLYPLITEDPSNPDLVKSNDGKIRNSMMWHFPHDALESAIIIDNYKLVKNYDTVRHPGKEEFELYQLYENKEGQLTRLDIEESKNLASEMPEKTQAMNQQLTEILIEMNASYPLYNPKSSAKLPNKGKVPTGFRHILHNKEVEVSFETNGAKVVKAHLIYTTFAKNAKFQEWFQQPMTLSPEGSKAHIQLPEGSTYYYINLIDENNFLVSYPEIAPLSERAKDASFADEALIAPRM